MPFNKNRRTRISKRQRSPTNSMTRHHVQGQSSTKADHNSDSPDAEAPSTDYLESQSSQEENSKEDSQEESTSEYSEQSRAAIRIEMLRSQLNLWEQQRRKRSSKRHNRKSRKSIKFTPSPKPKVLPVEPATNSQKRTTTTDEQLCSTNNSRHHQRAKPPAAAARNTKSQLSAQTYKRGLTNWVESAKKMYIRMHQHRNPSPPTPSEHITESPSIPSEPITEYPATHPVSQTAELQSPTPDPPLPTEHTTHPIPVAWTLLARLPAEQINFLDYITRKLSEQPGINEVTSEETIEGSHKQTSIRIKGSIQALYDAQANLVKTGQQDVTWEKYPPSPAGAANPNRWQTWEPAKTHSPHPGTPEPSTEDKKAGREDKPPIQHSGSETTHTQPPTTGYMKNIHPSGKFGFIKMDDDNDIFVMPSSCSGFIWKIPPIGTRVTFSTKFDTKSKKDKAINVRPETTEHSGMQRKSTKYPSRSPIGS